MEDLRDQYTFQLVKGWVVTSVLGYESETVPVPYVTAPSSE